MLFLNSNFNPVIGTYYEKGFREINQDSLLLQSLITRKGHLILAAICDGLGGMDSGEIASGYVCEQLSCWFYNELISLTADNAGEKLIINSLNRLLISCHYDLQNYGKRNNYHSGTTISLFLFVFNKAIIFHIGDSAIYKIQSKSRCLTPAQIINKDILNSCIGIGELYKPYINSFYIKKDDSFLIASDGFYHFLNINKLNYNLKQFDNDESVSKILRTIGKKNLSLNENDNMSAIMILFRG